MKKSRIISVVAGLLGVFVFLFVFQNCGGAGSAASGDSGQAATPTPTITITIPNVSVVPGSNAVFTVTLSQAIAQNITFTYGTLDGTATQPAYYASTNGTLTINAGMTSGQISVPTTGNYGTSYIGKGFGLVVQTNGYTNTVSAIFSADPPAPPLANLWSPFPGTTQPASRLGSSAVWTGAQMIVYGGYGNGAYYNDGFIFSPASQTWGPIAGTSGPQPRYAHVAVWTGSEMLVFGGIGSTGSSISDGQRFNPNTGVWTAMNPAGAPSPRYNATAVWTGSKMLLFGGSAAYPATAPLNDLYEYDPMTNAWTAIATTGTPAPRAGHVAVWTGSKMIVFGGYNGATLNSGAIYDPTTKAWTALTMVGLTARSYATAVWNGSKMIIWGGFNGSAQSGGATFDPATNTWSALATAGAPSARWWHTAVWGGDTMYVWGGGLSNSGGFVYSTDNKIYK